MKPIKFRAWDNLSEKMYDVYQLDFYVGYRRDIDPVRNVYVLTDGQTSVDNFVLMQYTGLKDRHGIEIYESDIVKQKPLNSTDEKIGVCNISPTQGVCFGAYPYFVTPCEVIGNIYENPELLKG